MSLIDLVPSHRVPADHRCVLNIYREALDSLDITIEDAKFLCFGGESIAFKIKTPAFREYIVLKLTRIRKEQWEDHWGRTPYYAPLINGGPCFRRGVVFFNRGGIGVAMYCQPLLEEVDDREAESFRRKIERKDGRQFWDFRKDQLGYYGDRIVCHDYAAIIDDTID